MNSLTLGRRAFLTAAGAGAITACTARAHPAPGIKSTGGEPIGVQLYSVGPQAAADLDGTLAALATIGYRTVELAGYIGKTPAELRAALDRAGLKCTSTHVGGRVLRAGRSLNDDPAILAEEGHILGFDTVVMPLFNVPERLSFDKQPGEDNAALIARLLAAMTEDDWKANAAYLNEKGKGLKAHGLKIGYHNHNCEFAPLAGGTILDLLLRETDPAIVSFELDVGWVAAAGADPAALIAKHPHRFTALHLKDIKPSTVPNFNLKQDGTEVGSGTIDWHRLMPTARKAGIKRFFVEQEPPFEHPVLDSLKTGFDFLAGLNA
jgi:sugar phosphate isomerase/epimerase